MNFPTLSVKPDGGSYKIELSNPAYEITQTDGEYNITRARYTRTPPSTISFKYTLLQTADKASLKNFWLSVAGSATAFTFVDPVDGTNYNVRFKQGFKLQFMRQEFTGLWDTNEILLEEV